MTDPDFTVWDVTDEDRLNVWLQWLTVGSVEAALEEAAQ